MAFALYRLPGKAESEIIIQINNQLKKYNAVEDISDSSGFIISPFVHTPYYKSYVIDAEIFIKESEINHNLLKQVSSIPAIPNAENSFSKHKGEFNKEEYVDLVKTCQANIVNPKFTKVVLSRTLIKQVELENKIHKIYQLLCTDYIHAFVNLWNIPGIGCWMGASPEPFLLGKENHFSTVSLAGTQTYNNKSIENASWNNKELKEQKIVTSFIEEALNMEGIANYSAYGPFTQKAANLLHLRTDFKFTIENQSIIGELIKRLHPTPSVCGYPKGKALAYILQNEIHTREYYSGIIGPMNMYTNTNLFVNLRCMKILPRQIMLFAGAGITKDSIAKNEWKETNLKINTLLSVIERYTNNE